MIPAPTISSERLPASDPIGTDSCDAYPAASPAAWYALRVRSRHEVLVGVQLIAIGAEPFCPFFVDSVRWSDREKRREMPWFPGYVFVRFGEAGRTGVLNVRGVIEVLSLDQRPCPIPDEQIATLKLLAQNPVLVSPIPYVAAGETIRVRCGPFVNCVGVVVRLKGRVRLVVQIEMLGKAVSVELDGRDVETEEPQR